MLKNWNPHTLLMRMLNGAATMENFLMVPQNAEHRIINGTEIPPLSIYLKELKTGTWANTCTHMFILALFTIVKGGNNPNIH